MDNTLMYSSVPWITSFNLLFSPAHCAGFFLSAVYPHIKILIRLK
ncbi:hypothetical protein PRUB_a1180 [Pseudoalteromonas rubra]|uniref:Uncharacterized protein n=1 Tax=Pseudoalteromonas rubra TaxID=43658 RepID=A0A8T0C7H9_9GAMM|nr:hypothetical protein PRUB_a1180 [Pseudoalteromonas rubra]